MKIPSYFAGASNDAIDQELEEKMKTNFTVKMTLSLRIRKLLAKWLNDAKRLPYKDYTMHRRSQGGGGSWGARDPPFVSLLVSKQLTIFR